MYDAIIVGARVAGAPTAMLLAQKGYRVLLVDRATFPSDTLSTHGIWASGVARLKRWGVLDEVLATNCPPLPHGDLDLGPLVLRGGPPPVDGIDYELCPRRTKLDKILVDAAVRAGAELREGFSVQELTWEGDAVTGLSGRTAGGAMGTERARIVIGADGLHSVVARGVQAPSYNERPAQACYYYSYWSGIEGDGWELFPRENRFVGRLPTNDGLSCIIVGWPVAEFHEFRSDIEGNIMRTVALAPSLAERMRGATREERFAGTADLPGVFRKPYGPGWALVGDAGYHKDPIMGHGITDAFLDAERLAEAIDAGFSGRQPLEQALAGYEQARNQQQMPLYELQCQLASLQAPPPELQQLLGALYGNQEATNRFFGVLDGSIPFPEFFAPENIGQIMAAAAAPA